MMKSLLDSLPRYIKFPSVEEENALVVEAKAGDKTAIMQLIRFSGPMIHRRIRLARIGPDQRDDLASCIMMNVMKAIDLFNFDKKARFVNYATFWVRNAIVDFNEQSRLMKFPSTRGRKTLYDACNQLRGLRRKNSSVNFRDHLREIAQKNDVKEEELFAYMSQSYGNYNEPSVGPAQEDEGGIIGSLVDGSSSPEEITSFNRNADILRTALSSLKDREKIIIELRYLNDDQSLEELGNLLNITRERVRQIESKALSALKMNIEKLTKSTGGIL